MTVGRLATHAVLLATVFVVPRELGSAEYGRYAAVMAVVAILQTVSTLGFGVVEARFLAPLARAPERDAASALGSSIWAARLALSAAVGVAAFAWFALTSELAFGIGACALLAGFCVARCAVEGTRSLFLPVGRISALVGFELLRAGLTLPVVLLLFDPLGLEGVFGSLGLGYALLFLAAAATLRPILGFRLSRARWSHLRPYVHYSLWAWAGTLAGIVQAQFAVFVVATAVAPDEAAQLGLAVQLYVLLEGLFVAARRSLMPVMSELESAGEVHRLAYWGGLMLRYAVAGATMATVAWALVGDVVVRALLGPEFAPVYACATWMLVCVVGYCAGATCNGLLYVRGHPRAASLDLAVYAAATMLGLALVVGGEPGDAALRISVVYAASAGLFTAVSAWVLARRGGIALPLLRAGALASPLLLAWPAHALDAGLGARVAALAVFLVAYPALAVACGLTPARELRGIRRALRGEGTGGTSWNV